MPMLRVPNAVLNYELYPSTPVPSKPWLLLIHGGNGALNYYRPMASTDILQSRFNICIYDRRGFTRSSLTGPQDYSGSVRLETDTDDAKALIQHLSSDGKAFVLGNSSGAIVTLMLLQRHPDVIRTCFAHEPPAESIMPNRDYWEKLQQDVYDTYRAQGHVVAMAKFMDVVKAKQDRGFATGAEVLNNPYFLGNLMYWFEREFVQYVFQEWDLEKLASLREKLVLVNGKDTHPEAPQFLSNVEMAKKLGLEVTMFCGGHVAFGVEPEQFAREIVECLQKRGDI